MPWKAGERRRLYLRWSTPSGWAHEGTMVVMGARRLHVEPGQRFDRLTVIREIPETKRKIECRCDCGKIVTPEIHALTCGRARSCGCLHRELTSAVGRRTGPLQRKHHAGPGERFGRLVVVREAAPHVPNGHWQAECRCDCGQMMTAGIGDLRRGNTKSCGCLQADVRRVNGALTVDHGLWSHPLYKTWSSMIRRCTNSQDKSYSNYGGRGISVYPDWLNGPTMFISWIEDNLGARPNGMSLDRINNDGDYEPGNIRWATAMQQRHNRRDSVVIL